MITVVGNRWRRDLMNFVRLEKGFLKEGFASKNICLYKKKKQKTRKARTSCNNKFYEGNVPVKDVFNK